MSMRRSLSLNDTSRRRHSSYRQGESGRMSAADMGASLVKAIRGSDEAWMTALLAAGAPPNTRDDQGRPVLCLLLETSGSPDTCKTLLERGAQPNLPSLGSGQTALHVAAKKGFQVCIGQLLMAGANPDLPDAFGNSPLMYACANGHNPSARMLLQAGALAGRTNQRGETAMHLAAKHGCLGCVRELLTVNCSINSTDCRGITPLLIAAINNQSDVLQLLLDKPCNIDDQDPSTGRTAVHWAVFYHDLLTLTKLIQRGADLDLRDVDWNTGFLIATNLGDYEAARLLVEAGCDVMVTDKSFNTALHLTSSGGYSDLIPIFVESGLNLDLRGSGGMTALMHGAFGGHERVVSTLLDLGASANILDRHRASALVYAILSNASQDSVVNVVKRLILYNADLEEGANLIGLSRSISLPSELAGPQVEDRLYSPVEVAFLRGNSSLCVLLARAGCDLTVMCQLSTSKTNGRRTTNKDLLQRLVQHAKRQRIAVPTLKELCRRPVLERISQFTSLAHIEELHLPKDLIHFLRYDDLLVDLKPTANPANHVRRKNTAGSRSNLSKNVKEPVTLEPNRLGAKLTQQEPVPQNQSKTPGFQRNSRLRSTIAETPRIGNGNDHLSGRRTKTGIRDTLSQQNLQTPVFHRQVSQTSGSNRQLSHQSKSSGTSVGSSSGCVTPKSQTSGEANHHRSKTPLPNGEGVRSNRSSSSHISSRTISAGNLSRQGGGERTKRDVSATRSRTNASPSLEKSKLNPRPEATPWQRQNAFKISSV